MLYKLIFFIFTIVACSTIPSGTSRREIAEESDVHENNDTKLYFQGSVSLSIMGDLNPCNKDDVKITSTQLDKNSFCSFDNMNKILSKNILRGCKDFLTSIEEIITLKEILEWVNKEISSFKDQINSSDGIASSKVDEKYFKLQIPNLDEKCYLRKMSIQHAHR